MPKSMSLIECYDQCVSEGYLIPQQEIDINRIKSMLEIAKDDLESAKELMKTQKWNTIYKLNYDVLHTLTEALLRFDRIKSENHKCLFSFLCAKHPELDFDWGFFEKIRTKRNGINYYGNPVDSADWKEIELQLNLYIKTLMKAAEEKLKFNEI